MGELLRSGSPQSGPGAQDKQVPAPHSRARVGKGLGFQVRPRLWPPNEPAPSSQGVEDAFSKLVRKSRQHKASKLSWPARPRGRPGLPELQVPALLTEAQATGMEEAQAGKMQGRKCRRWSPASPGRWTGGP